MRSEAAWRGFEREDLLGRARSAAESSDLSAGTLELIDEMEQWSAHDLYLWLEENDSSFASESRAKAMASKRA